MDSNGVIIQNETPSILDIKPVEKLDIPVDKIPKEEVLSDIEIDDMEKKDIFLKPESEQKKRKKKKVISEKQRIHLENMRKKLREKQAQRRKEKGKPEPKPKPKHNIDDLYAKIEELMSSYSKPTQTPKVVKTESPRKQEVKKPIERTSSTKENN